MPLNKSRLGVVSLSFDPVELGRARQEMSERPLQQRVSAELLDLMRSNSIIQRPQEHDVTLEPVDEATGLMALEPVVVLEAGVEQEGAMDLGTIVSDFEKKLDRARNRLQAGDNEGAARALQSLLDEEKTTGQQLSLAINKTQS